MRPFFSVWCTIEAKSPQISEWGELELIVKHWFRDKSLHRVSCTWLFKIVLNLVHRRWQVSSDVRSCISWSVGNSLKLAKVAWMSSCSLLSYENMLNLASFEEIFMFKRKLWYFSVRSFWARMTHFLQNWRSAEGESCL